MRLEYTYFDLLNIKTLRSKILEQDFQLIKYVC